MPVVRHQAVRKERHLVSRERLDQHALERNVVVRAGEEWQTFGRAIERMEDEACFLGATGAWHAHARDATSMPRAPLPTVLFK